MEALLKNLNARASGSESLSLNIDPGEVARMENLLKQSFESEKDVVVVKQ